MEPINLMVESGPQRLDKALAVLLPEFTRSGIARLIEEGRITVEAKTVSKSLVVKAGTMVTICLPAPQPCESQPENIPLDIVYEDDDLLVVNKPQGMVVHPAAGNQNGTLVNALLYHCEGRLSTINGVVRPGIVHRIDKDTSGLLLVAKNDLAHNSLAGQIKAHTLLREYEAVVHGNVKNDAGTVDASIGRHPVKRKQMAVTDKNAKNAVTHYRVLARYNGFTHLRLRLETGRTHQIRVHMAYLGHPVAGDPLYGPHKPAAGLNGQCLHAKTVGFLHPRDDRELFFDSQLPEYFLCFLRRIGAKEL